METSQIRQKIAILKSERDQIETELLNVRQKLVRGTVVDQMRKCNQENCKCAKGELHGPFQYLSVVVNGKPVHRYIGKAEDKNLLVSLKKYKKFKDNLTRLNKIQKELTDLWQEYRKNLVMEVTDIE